MSGAAANQLLILIASDLHDDLDGISHLHRRLRDDGVSPDLVLCPGDLTTMDSTLGQRPADSVLAEYTQRGQQVLRALSDISAQLYWVPGNHDPDTMFERPESNNVHGRMIQLAPGLWLAGWGGCVAATERGHPVWGAYPYSDDQLPAMLGPLAAGIAELPAEDTLVLLTHAGPAISSTTVVTGTDPNSLLAAGVRDHSVLSGSSALDELVQSESVQRHAILNIHGHTHQATGVARVGGVTVLNPGSLRYTKSYALVKLDRTASGRWRRASIQIVELS